jgi:cobalt-zinc-cadmium efflux system protein
MPCNQDSKHHDCEPPSGHTHAPVSSAKMGLAIGLTLGFVVVEAVAGGFAHSLALLSDAGHNFADAAALGLSWYALWIAKKPSHSKMTFGYHRVGILAALVNAISLVVIALLILWEAIERLHHPDAARGGIMIAVAAVAVALNFTIGSWLHAGSHHDINVRAARLHMLGDAVSALGVVIAGIVIAVTGMTMIDPAVSFLIAGLILLSSWSVLKESVCVLLEGTPAGMDMAAVEQNVSAVEGVVGVHDLHVWTVGPGVIAACLHVMVEEQTVRSGQQVIKAVATQLRQLHRINHTTVQVEVEGHSADDMYCCIEPADVHAGHHH